MLGFIGWALLFAVFASDILPHVVAEFAAGVMLLFALGSIGR